LAGIQINGSCEKGFEAVKTAFAANFAAGKELGASFALTVNGKFVVDVWGGWADVAKTRPWQKDTIVNVFSSTKVMTSVCTWILVDRGLIDLDAPVARYWPEFGNNGKEKIPVRNLLSHSAGLPGFAGPTKPADLYDWEYITKMLAGQKPLWEPGKYSGYHGLTMGYLLGEVIRRVTGKTVGTFLHDEVAVPLNADFHIGLADAQHHRVAEMIPMPPLKPGDAGFIADDPDSIRGKVNATQPQAQAVVNDAAWRRAEIPAANGHGNAHAMARVGAVLACGGELDGVRLMGMKTIEKVLEEQTNGVDLMLNTPLRWGLGVELNTAEKRLGPNTRVFSWGGMGGSMIVVDLDARLSWAYAMNKMGMGAHFLDPRNITIKNTIYNCL
jgi:CubicO group peptidase (beta-lactamase class C family)